VYIHTYCDKPIERHRSRELSRQDKGVVLSEDERKKRADFHEQNLVNTEKPLDLQLPLLEVDTSDGYNPKLDEIITFIEKAYE